MKPAATSTTPDPAAALNVRDVFSLAKARLDAAAWAYFCGAAGDEITLHDNEAAWRHLRLLPRVGRDLTGGHTRLSMLGRDWAHPILVAPMAYLRWAHADGELGTALAAAAQGAGLVLSAQASTPLEDVAALVRDEADRGPLWFQISPQPERALTLSLARRARNAGFEALVLTFDAPLRGVRDRERAAQARRPAGIEPVNLRATSTPTFARSHFDHAARHAAAWLDIPWLSEASGLPVLVKGVMHPEDALLAEAHGAAGVIVSNHGGRTLDTVRATAEALPEVAEALGGRVPLIVDGGLRRGTDVLKALALGADAVMVGRPCAMALAAGGSIGVARWLRLLRDELEIAMALCGCATLGDLGPAWLRPAGVLPAGA